MVEEVVSLAVEGGIEEVVSLAVEGGKGLFNCLERKYVYVKNISKYFNDLERAEKYLCAKEEDVKKDLENNKLKMEMTCTCRVWLDDVETMKVEVQNLKANYHNAHKFLCGLCPFPCLLKLAKQIEKKTSEVSSLEIRFRRKDTMVERAPAPIIKIHAKKAEAFPSLKKHVEMLLQHLGNEELKRICVWGPPGVGKTTIMENLYNEVVESPKFDITYMVSVTDISTRDIQEKLFKYLYGEAQFNVDQRADLISKKLENKRYVLFFDDVSSEIDWRQIGIHDEHRQGKVVFACRCRNICGQTDEDINVQRLSDEDAQNLFWKIVGENLKHNRDIKRAAGQIILECSGMPHMIKLIGNSLANVSNPAIWRDTLNQLRSPTDEPRQELDEFYKFFNFVCKKLQKMKLSCLLYWATFPVGYELHLDCIIDCWRAEEFLNFKRLGEARDRGHAILDEFVKKSLLENGRKVAHYKMFEHFQRVALRIANKENDYNILVKEGENIREEEWKDVKRISLIRLSQSTLPQRPECGRLLALLLQESKLEEFPISFFGSMCNLQHLKLQNTEIRLLPSSISSLKNLKALLLHDCSKLIELPAEVGDLQSLEILDIKHTGLHGLPIEIGQLTDLKSMRVSFTETVGNHNHVGAGPMEMISSNVIARLNSLEELSIDVEPNSRRWNQIVENVATEVAGLEELTTLSFYFPKVDCFQTFINTSKSWNGNSFRSFNIRVGYHHRSSPTEVECSAEKLFRFSDGDGFPDAVLKILEQAFSFELIGHRTAANLSDIDTDKVGGLEACTIEDCKEMINIIDGNLTGGVALRSLKDLHINNLSKLVDIWKGPIGSESLYMLKTLTVKGCHRVRVLFSQEMVLRLNQLQYLQVENCEGIEEIISSASIVESTAFPKLKTLELVDLPRLSHNGCGMSLAWSSLEDIVIKSCEKLQRFPFPSTENATKLKVIRCTQAWWNQLVWPDNNVRDNFQRFACFI